MPSKANPHPEERPKGASRRTQGRWLQRFLAILVQALWLFRPTALALLSRLRGDLHRIGAVAVAEGGGVDLFELDFAAQHLGLPSLLLGHARVEFGHHLAGEEFEALADVLVRVLAGLVQQNDLVDMRALEPPQLAPQGLR